MLLRSVVGQQLSVAAARTIWQRFVVLNGGRRFTPAKILRMDPSDFRNIGISAAKTRAVQSIAKKLDSGVVQLKKVREMDDDAAIAELTQLRGIGPWTAQMYLMFSLGRLDVFPAGDLGIVNAMTELYRLPGRPERAELIKLSGPWKPYRTIGSWYCWQALDLVRAGLYH